MRRVLLIVVMLLVPTALTAEIATMGIFFDLVPGSMADWPTPFVAFDVYVYLHNAGYYVTAVEYQLLTPTDPGHASYGISSVDYPPEYSIHLGDPFIGHSITYWPPLDGYSPGYNLLCKIKGFTTLPCCTSLEEPEGTLCNYWLVIGPHPDTGECKGTYWPDNLAFPIVGRTSVICPEPIAVKEESWGAIKILFDE
ncbi:MAG TPA: hypothetical protein VMX58_09865 [Patescibacteria group bacterium]|nr:hypothetical protein [Patescibacteria group bacterium]